MVRDTQVQGAEAGDHPVPGDALKVQLARSCTMNVQYDPVKWTQRNVVINKFDNPFDIMKPIILPIPA